MELAILLDDNEQDVEELQKVILSLNSSIEFRVFQNVEGFASWFHEFADDPPKGEVTITLLVSNRKILGQRHSSLFEKINTYMNVNGFTPEGHERIPMIITAQNSSGFKRETYQLRIFDNIIYKPFDAAVARGKINWSLCREDALSDEELTKQKPASPLEMLKSVHIDRITELGFRTVSTEEIPLGRLARYYLPSLKALGKDYGVFASCTSCEPLEQGKYLCSFSYFGLGPTKVKNIRHIISNGSETSELPLPGNSRSQLGVAIVCDERDLSERLQGSLSASFQEIEMVTFKNFTDFYLELNPKGAIEAWLESLEETRTAIFEYFRKDHLFTRAFINGEEEVELENYLGLRKEQMIHFRTLLLKSVDENQRHKVSLFWLNETNQKLTLTLPGRGASSYITIEKSVFIDADEEHPERIQISLRPATAEELSKQKTERKVPAATRLLLVSERVFLLRDMEFWQAVREEVNPGNKVEIIVVGKTNIDLYDMAKKYEGVADYIVDPYDSSYLKRRIKQTLPEITTTEKHPSRLCAHADEMIQVGVQVQVKNFSEVSLSVEYGRELEKESFRDFLIYIQAEKKYEELVAKHVSAEQISDGLFLNHFSLFGHGDDTNQLIREWLNEQYVLNKAD